MHATDLADRFETRSQRRAPPQDVRFRRRTLHRTESLLIEDSALPFAQALGHDYSPNEQFAFPYFGAFTWRVGTFERLVDPNTVLKVKGGEEFFEAHPVRGIGHASLILTPSPGLLNELCASARRGEGSEAPTVAPMTDRIRLMVHELTSATMPSLRRDEIAVDLLTRAVRASSVVPCRASRLVERAKSLLQENYSLPVSLGWIARQLDVTPVYLTQTFRRQEGVPLYRYQTRLRLNRALLLLEQCDSITDVALELGYSSHAHFTAAFGRAFQMTPHAYRASRRARGRRA